MTSPVPEGFHTVNAHLSIKGAKKALQFYERAFGAEVMVSMEMPDGESLMHAEMRIGTSRVLLADEMPGGPCSSPSTLGGTSVSLMLYVENVDQAFAKAVAAGAEVIMPVTDMFWGDRYCMVKDPFGHQWEIATHKKDLSPDEIKKGAEAFFAQMGPGGDCAV